jgi:diaminopimelate epimerase
MDRKIRFWKYHALGNDYLVLTGWSELDLPELARRICERHRGIGADGILIEVKPPKAADFGVRIFNPDGSEAEKSGNGLRVFCRWLWDSHRLTHLNPIVREGYAFRVQTNSGTVKAFVPEGGDPITIGMGQISIVRSSRLSEKLVDPSCDSEFSLAEVEGVQFRAIALNLGNPHFVIDTRTLAGEDWKISGRRLAMKYGKILECNPCFPERTNVQFLMYSSQTIIGISIWERGAGYTLSSGSSACASAFAANYWGLCDAHIRVLSEGGELDVRLDYDQFATLMGPVVPIGEGLFWQI